MNRSTIVLAATAAGVGATLGFHTHAPAATRTTTTATSTAKVSTSGSTKIVTSAVEPTRYGPLQLKVTISSGKITAIQALQLPSNDPKSVEIGNYAEPLLRQSALSAQRADIDVVSGATYTSDGYKAALQSALDKA